MLTGEGRLQLGLIVFMTVLTIGVMELVVLIPVIGSDAGDVIGNEDTLDWCPSSSNGLLADPFNTLFNDIAWLLLIKACSFELEPSIFLLIVKGKLIFC